MLKDDKGTVFEAERVQLIEMLAIKFSNRCFQLMIV